MEDLTIVRVGLGYDIHKLVNGRKLVLAGVEVAFGKGLLGHSDADVVLHAVIDALLGAAGLDDIGGQFPDTDPAYNAIASSKLLEITLEKVAEAGYAPANVDVTIIAEKPKLTDYKAPMRQRLAQLLGLDSSAVSIKAKTNETLGEIGQGKAIACYAIAGLARKSGFMRL